MSNTDEGRTEAIKEDANMSTGNYAQWYFVDRNKLERLGIPQYKLKKGPHFIRIVAPSSKGRFGKVIERHQNVGANGSTYLCMSKMFDKPCAVCDYIKTLKEQNASSQQIRNLETNRRILLFVVDVKNTEAEDEGPKWCDCPISIYKNICDLSTDKRSGATIDVSHPTKGKDIEFVRKDIKGDPYTGYKLVDAKPIPDWWYKDLPQFDDVLLIPSYDEVAKEVSGLPVETSAKTTNTEQVGEREQRGSRGRMGEGGTEKDSEMERTEEEDGEGRRGSRASRASRSEKPTDESSEQAASVRRRIEEIEERRRSRSKE